MTVIMTVIVREWKGSCHRCGSKTLSYTMSFFNTDLICDPCDLKERDHPDFDKAHAAETAECGKGNFNFPGIGLPKDLYGHG